MLVAWANPNQLNTPISHRFSTAQTVTVTDPRHPLCGRTLPLVGITNKAYLGRCCVVWIHEDVERYVPVSATNLEFDPNHIHPTPLSVASVKALLQVFESIQPSNQGDLPDAISSGKHDTSRSPTRHCSPASLDSSE